jgi:serine/threonine protein kinase
VSEIREIKLKDEKQLHEDSSEELQLSTSNSALSLSLSKKIKTSSKHAKEVVDDDDDEDYIQGVVQDRQFMQNHYLRLGKDCRYAIKTMRDVCRTDSDIFTTAMVDLAIEAKFLSVVRHPNIIKMRAMSEGDLIDPYSFVILDRLHENLVHRIEVWQKKSKNNWGKLFDFQKKKEKAFFADRLTVAYDVASALEYLHNLNIIYRDLKPDNIGFDVRGELLVCSLLIFVGLTNVRSDFKNP